MRIGIIGTGSMGRARARAVANLDGLYLSWVCSRDEQRAGQFIAELRDEGASVDGCAPLGDWTEAIERTDADAVIIATPNTHHFAPAKAAIDAGKHVLVEYPPTATVEDCEQLLALAQTKGVAFCVGLTHRHSGSFAALKQLVGVEGQLGQPWLYLATSCGGRPIGRWYNRSELTGGTFISSIYDMAAVAMDLAGSVSSVHGSYQSTRRPDGVITRDCASIMLTFEAGGTAQLNYARGFPAPGLGGNTTICCQNGYVISVGGEIRKLTPQGEDIITSTQTNAVEADVAAFIAAANDPQTPDPTGPFSLDVLRVVAAGAESATANH